MEASTILDVARRPKGQRMAAGVTYSFISMIIVRAATVVNSIIVIRSLSLFDYGMFSIVGLTISSVSTVAFFGIPQAMVKFLSEDSGSDSSRPGRLVGTGLILVVTTTSIAVAGLVAAIPLAAADLYKQPGLEILLLVATIGMIMSAVSSPFLAILQAFEKIREWAIVNAVATLMSVPLTYLLVAHFSLMGAVIATVVAGALNIVAYVPSTYRVWRALGTRLTFHTNPTTFRKFFGFCLPALTSALLVAPVLWFSNTLLATRGSFSEVGSLSASEGLTGLILYIPSAVGVPLTPIVSRLGHEPARDLSSFLTRTMRVVIALILMPALLLVIFPSVFLGLLFGGSYISASPLVKVLAPCSFLAGLASVVGYAISGTGRMWHGLLLNLVWACAFAASSWMLVPTLGALGLAIALLIGYSLHILAALVYARFQWSLNLRDIAPPFIAGLVSIIAAELMPFDSSVLGLLLGTSVLLIAGGCQLALMSGRERDVLVDPLKRVLSWAKLHH